MGVVAGVAGVRWLWLMVVAAAGLAAAGAGTVLAVAVNVATGGTAHWLPPVERHPLWWTAGATAVLALAGLAGWAAQRRYDRSLAEMLPVVQRPEAWVIGRPAEVTRIAAALRRRGGRTVAVTTAVHGAGGFGKTTVARMVRADPRVLRRFRGRVYWITVGRDAGREELPGLVNDLLAQVEPSRAAVFTSVRPAADHLAAVLAQRPRRLVIVDDVWTEEQLAAFPVAGRSARLVTTRNPTLAAAASGAGAMVPVDEMTGEQARAVLLAGLPPLPAAVADDLAEETWRWPLLLRLANQILARHARLQLDVTQAALDLLDRLRTGGAVQVDQLAGTAGGRRQGLSDPEERARTVRATIEASTSLLSTAGQARLADLAVFAEDEAIPVPLASRLWHSTGDMDQMAAADLCAQLADLALITLSRTAAGGVIELHDVIRDHLRHHIGPARLRQLNKALLEAAAAEPPAIPVADAGTAPGSDRKVTAWWELPARDRYLRHHLIEHLKAADHQRDAEALATDLRWVATRLDHDGPAAPHADLARAGTPLAGHLARILAQNAHLLAPTDPAYSLTDILCSRVSHDQHWAPQAQAIQATRAYPALTPAWPPPDTSHPGLRRTIRYHAARAAVAVAPDATWFATASDKGGTMRIWDTATGQPRGTHKGHNKRVTVLAAAADSTCLATASLDGTVRTWDTAAGQPRATLTGKLAANVTALAVAPDGTWLATAHKDGTVRTWDTITGRQRDTLKVGLIEDFHRDIGRVTALAVAANSTCLAAAGRGGTVRTWDTTTWRYRTAHVRWPVTALAIAPDGTWLATGHEDGTVRTWDTATGQPRATLIAHIERVTAIVVAPDGTWLASLDGTVRTWDTATGQRRATLSGEHAEADIAALAVAPDGTWLATGHKDGTVRTWDFATTGQSRATLTGHTKRVTAIAIAPDGTWLATHGLDRTVRTWDASWRQSGTFNGHVGQVTIVAVAPDSTWLASAHGRSGTVQTWNTATGQPRATLTVTGRDRRVTALAIAPDGTWLATGHDDGTMRTWDTATGQPRATLTVTGRLRRVTALAIAPDGTWLATASFRRVRTWDTATGQPRATLTVTGRLRRVTALAIAPDGTWLATASGRRVRTWDTATGQPRATLKCRAHRATIARAILMTWEFFTMPDAIFTGYNRSVFGDFMSSVAVAPDGTWLATGHEDGTVRTWDTATGQPRATLAGHTDGVSAIAIAPDGTRIATTSWDGTIRIWDAEEDSALAVTRADDMLNDCAWSSQGQALAAAGFKGTYYFTVRPARRTS
jgi:WD40 repeat protein